MHIAIITDMEGTAGVINLRDWCLRESRYYEEGKLLATEEVNAAVRGFFAAGAHEITIIDGHGYGGICPYALDERVYYSRGWAVPHQFGLNAGYDAIAWVGQHAKAGTKKAHLAHTGSMDALDMKINGISMGEFGEIAAIAGFYGVPAIFGSGDRAFCEEAKALLPQVHTVDVKYGVTLDDGADCTEEEYIDHNAGAVHLHPKRARALIEEGACRALRDFLARPENYRPFVLEAPYIHELWIRPSKTQRGYKLTRQHEEDLVALYSTKATRTTL